MITIRNIKKDKNLRRLILETNSTARRKSNHPNQYAEAATGGAL